MRSERRDRTGEKGGAGVLRTAAFPPDTEPLLPGHFDPFFRVVPLERVR